MYATSGETANPGAIVKYRAAVWSISVAIVLVSACLLPVIDPTCVFWGLLNDESFYRGRPTTYWSRKIRAWHKLPHEEQQRCWREDPGFESPLFDPDPSAVPVLIELLVDRDVGVHCLACNKLGNLGPDAKAAVPALAAMLRHHDVFYRRRASHTLACIAPEATPALGVLIEGLRDEDAWVSYHCAMALGRIGPGAKVAFPVLMEALKCPKAQVAAYPGSDWTVGDAVTRALELIDPEAAAQAGIRGPWNPERPPE